MSKSRLIGIVAAIALVTIAIVYAIVAQHPMQPGHGLSKIKCAVPSGNIAADPIVHHNEPVPVGHEHLFFSNLVLPKMANPNAANYDDLVGKATNCLNPSDTAAYWVPTLRYKSTGGLVPVRAMRAYYRTFDTKDFGPVADALPFPKDVRLIANNDNKETGWFCGQFNPQPLGPALPTCNGTDNPGHELALHVTFPSCWDGVVPNHGTATTPPTTTTTTTLPATTTTTAPSTTTTVPSTTTTSTSTTTTVPVTTAPGTTSPPDTAAPFVGNPGVYDLGDTRDNAHWAYTVNNVCPIGKEKHVTELRLDITYGYWNGNAANDLVLSSDAAAGQTAGRSVHGDFWNTWVQSGLKQMIVDCITSGSLKPAFPRECD